jgi:pimeloyl-ACP methyl ester carboxylesterase
VSGCPAEIEVPTLVIHRAADPRGPAANGRVLAERIAGACLILREGVGHIPEVEVAAQFDRDLIGFPA